MKKTLLLTFLTLSIQFSFAQNFAWVQAWGTQNWDYSRSATTDGDGNVFVTGYFRNTMDADPGPAVRNLVSSGETDVFISKFNASGTLLWARQISGPMDELVNEITSDSDGNIYITGSFKGTVDFDPSTSMYNLTAATINGYICKLDNDGNLLWAKMFDGGAPIAYDIAVDASQNVYTVGRFNALTDFDPGPGVYNLDAYDYTDMFICKLSAAGALVWVKQIAEIGDTAVIKPKSIAVDLHGNICTTGIFNGTVDFDPGTGTFNMTSAGEETEVSFPSNVFVCKLDNDGNFVWAGSIAAEAEAESTGIAVDEDDNMYISGYFMNTVDFDPGPGLFELTSNATGANAYVYKLSPQGDFEWVKAFSGTTAVIAHAIVVDGNDVYTTGYFAGAIDFDPGTSTSFLVASGNFDVFVNKMDVDGNLLWAQKAGGAADENAYGIAVDPTTKNIFVTGVYTDTTNFDPSTETWKVPNRGAWDAFLFKLSDCLPNNGQVAVVETCNKYLWSENGGLYTTSGIYWNILTSSTGCDSTVKLDLTIWNHENVISMNLLGYLVSQSNTFIDEYKWINCETFEVVGTQGAYHPTVDGSYALISTSGNCVDTSACINVTVVGLNELEAAGFSLYPNPVADELMFESQNPLQAFEIEINAANGQLICKGSFTSGDKLSVGKWEPGIYLVKFISGDKSYVTRIVKA